VVLARTAARAADGPEAARQLGERHGAPLQVRRQRREPRVALDVDDVAVRQEEREERPATGARSAATPSRSANRTVTRRASRSVASTRPSSPSQSSAGPPRRGRGGGRAR
jgi:hypothetical protein